MKFNKAIFLFSVVLMTFAQHSLSETEITIDNLVVTATKTSLPKDNVLVPITIIDAEDIALSGANNLSEILQIMAGVDIATNGGSGQLTSVFMQGANSNHTLVLVNGIKINDMATGIAAIQNINPNIIDRIEIIKAPRTSLYGSNAIGGVINIITNQTFQSGYQVGYKIGSDKTSMLDLSSQFTAEKIQGGLHFNQYRTDGFPAKQGSDVNNGHNNDSLNAFLNITEDDWFIHSNIWFSSGTTEYLDFFQIPISQDFENLSGSIDINKAMSKQWTSNLNIGFTTDDLDQNDLVDFNDSRKIFFEWQNNFQVNENHQIVLGAYWAEESFEANNYGLIVDTIKQSKALYLEDMIAHGKHRFLAAARLSNKEEIDDKATWNLEYGYTINPMLRLFINSGKAIRNPSSFDLYGFGGNQELTPEESKNVGLGFVLIPADDTNIEFSAFSNQIEDLIVFDYSDFKLYNIEQTRTQGVESRFQWLVNDWNVSLNAKLQNPKNNTTGEVLLRRAKKTLSLGLRRSFGALDVNLSLLESGSRMDFGGIKLDGYTLANMTLQYHFNEAWLMRAVIQNVSDETYMLADGYNTAKRKVFLGIVYQPEY
jgi:vitamin B12 transporter